jgi:hypothetical protein
MGRNDVARRRCEEIGIHTRCIGLILISIHAAKAAIPTSSVIFGAFNRNGVHTIGSLITNLHDNDGVSFALIIIFGNAAILLLHIGTVPCGKTLRSAAA